VAAAKMWLGGNLIALQRSPGHLQFMDLASSNTFVQGAHKGRSEVMGFFWASTKACSFVIVTSQGMETYNLQSNKQGLEFKQQYAHSVAWWKYSHSARVLLLGTFDKSTWIQAYQFAAEGIVRLPPFQVAAHGPLVGSPGAPPPRLEAADVTIATLYSRIYCIVFDPTEQKLVLYRFFKDGAVVQQQIQVPPAPLRLAITDNLLLLFSPGGQAAVVDVKHEGGPIAENLPVVLAPSASSDQASSDQAKINEIGKLQFDLPNVILHRTTQEVWESSVDVEGIAASSRDWPTTVPLLLRRNPQDYKSDLPRLIISLVKEALVEQPGMAVVRQICDAVTAHGAAPATLASEKTVSITPQEFCKEVFTWLHSEEAVNAQYLQAALAEFKASAASHGVDLPLSQHFLEYEVALQLGLGYQVAMEVSCMHDKDCKELARQLDCWQQLPSHMQLANDARGRIDEYEQRCTSLIGQGKVLQAARLIQAQRSHLQHLVTTQLLDSARGQGAATFTAVYRACHASVPPEYMSFSTALSSI